MKRIALCALVFLVAWPLLRAEDKPSSPRQQLDDLVKESQQARKDYYKASDEAKTKEQRQRVNEEYEATTGRIAAALLALAEKNSNDAVAIDALSKVFELDGSVQEKKKAAELLLRDYLQSDKIAPICQSLTRSFDAAKETLLRTILAKNPHKHIRAEASFALAQGMHIRSYFRHSVPKELRTFDLNALEKDVAKIWNEFAGKYSADIPEERLATACLQLCIRGVNELESTMRILEKDKRRRIQGIACLVRGQILKRRADALADKDAKAAAKLRDESDSTLSRAAEKYGDVNITGIIVGDKAKHEQFELRHLSIGTEAPDIVGEDQDGKQLKLSDYKGKVILLDFWSQY